MSDLSPSEGYRLLREGAALVPAGHDLVWVRGRDAVSFLDSILSQDVAGLAEGVSARSLLLSGQGKLVALLRVVKTGEEEVALATHAGGAAALVEALTYYKIRVKAGFDVEERSLVEVWGPGGPSAVGGAAPDRWVRGDGVDAVPIPLARVPRFLVAGARPDLPEASLEVAAAVRIEEGEPVMGRDVDERTIPQETGLVDASVSFTKGCYVGQELVARIDSRGHVNRHLRGLVLDAPVPEGTGVAGPDGASVGTVTSVADSPRLGTVALALLRREVEPGSSVGTAGGVSAVVHAVPF